jgi:hypothetical protein
MLVFINFDNEISARPCRYRVLCDTTWKYLLTDLEQTQDSSNSPYRRIFHYDFLLQQSLLFVNTPDCNTRTVHPCRRCWSDHTMYTSDRTYHTRYLLREWREHPLYTGNKSVSGELSATGSTVRCFDLSYTLCFVHATGFAEPEDCQTPIHMFFSLNLKFM